MDVLLSGFWTDYLAPFLASLDQTLSRDSGNLWAVVAAVFLIAAAALISAISAHGTQGRTLRLAERLMTEQRRQMGAIETLQHELWNLSDDLNRLRADRELAVPAEGEAGLIEPADEHKLAHVTELLERLTENERERRQQIGRFDGALKRLVADIEGLKARLGEQEARAAQREAAPRAEAAPPAIEPEAFAEMREELARLAARFERLDALIAKLARLRVE